MDELDPRFKIRAPLRCDGIGRLDCAEDLESGMRMAVRWLPLEANGAIGITFAVDIFGFEVARFHQSQCEYGIGWVIA